MKLLPWLAQSFAYRRIHIHAQNEQIQNKSEIKSMHGIAQIILKSLLCETFRTTLNIAKTDYYLCAYFGLLTHQTLTFYSVDLYIYTASSLSQDSKGRQSS